MSFFCAQLAIRSAPASLSSGALHSTRHWVAALPHQIAKAPSANWAKRPPIKSWLGPLVALALRVAAEMRMQIPHAPKQPTMARIRIGQAGHHVGICLTVHADAHAATCVRAICNLHITLTDDAVAANRHVCKLGTLIPIIAFPWGLILFKWVLKAKYISIH